MQPLPPKKEVALALLERSNVFVHLDPRATAVIVPPWFKKQAQLVLQIGLNMPVPIPDLRLDDEGMSCTLSFNRSPFYCVVPWGSIFAMVGDDGRGMVWPDDVPTELATGVSAEPKRPSKRGADRADEMRASDAAGKGGKRGKKKKKKDERRPALSAVPKAGESRPAVADPARKPAPPPPARPTAPRVPAGPTRPKRELPPYLRVVK
jgi:stringent starvation protein B